MTLRLAQVALTVGDVGRAKNFYGEVLGLPHLFDAPPGLSFFQAGDTRLMLSAGDGAPSGNSILYYGTDDVEAGYQALLAKGVVFEEAPRCIARVDDRDVWLAICREPDGNMVGLMSERPASA